jgi:hypothetical protein
MSVVVFRLSILHCVATELATVQPPHVIKALLQKLIVSRNNKIINNKFFPYQKEWHM